MNRIATHWKSIIILFTITFLSIANTDKIKPDDLELFKHADKLVHFLMYFTLFGMIFLESYFTRGGVVSFRKKIYIASCVILFGTIMELCQALLTSSRSADTYDFLANSLGCFGAFFLFPLIAKSKLIKHPVIQYIFNKKKDN